MKKAQLGSGTRYANLKKKLAAKGVNNPGALAAWIGRKKLGKKKFQKLAAAGKKRSKKDTTPDATESKARKLQEKRMGMKS